MSGTTTGGCEFSSFSSGSKVRARCEMPTSGPGGVSAGKSLFRWRPFPRGKGCRIRSGPLLKMLPMERRKTMLRLCVVSPVPRPSFVHRLRSPLLPKINLLPIFLAFEPRWSLVIKLCSAAIFEVYGLFLWLLSCIYRASAIGATPNPPRCKNVGNGRSLVVAPVLCIQLVSANQYVRKTTKQRACKTVRQ